MVMVQISTVFGVRLRGTVTCLLHESKSWNLSFSCTSRPDKLFFIDIYPIGIFFNVSFSFKSINYLPE